MIAAGTYEISEAIEEAHRHLSNTEKNNGRAMRRFLTRISDDGGCRVEQVFACPMPRINSHYTETQMLALEDYAKQLASMVDPTVNPDGGVFVDTRYEPLAGTVKNSYRLGHPVKTATVTQLRAMVGFVLDRCLDMKPFAASPNETALELCPDYTYRGLPVSCARAPWMIGGVDVGSGGSGVLEWCYDQEDAEQRLAMMSGFARFTNLNAKPWFADF